MLILVDQDPYATKAGVVSVVRGGSSADPSGSDGLAHLFEHLTFRAVDQPSHLDRHERLIRSAAVESNGLTSSDTMTFYEFGPTAALLDLFDLEVQRLVDPLVRVDEASVEIERRVIASEFQLRDDPRAGLWASAHLVPLIFPALHPYAHTPGGSPVTRDALTISKARAYGDANFRPERMTLLVSAPAGTIDLEGLIKRMPPSLIGDASRPVTRPDPQSADTAPELHDHGLARVSSPLRAPQLWLAWVMPGSYGRHGPTETALTQWVEEDLDNDDLRRKDPHIRQAAATLIPGLAGSVLAVRVLLADGADADRVSEIVTDALATLWKREPAERDRLQRFQATAETELVLGEPPQVARALEQAQQAALTFRPLRPVESVEALLDVSSGELSAMARRLLTRERRQAVLFTPTEAGEVPLLPSKRWRPGRSGNLFRAAADWNAEASPRPIAPVSSLAMKHLANGLTVIVARKRAPSVVAWLGFHGGYADADPPILVEVARRLRPDAVDAPRHGALPARAATLDASLDSLEFRPPDLAPALAGLFAKGTIPIREWPSPATLDRLLASVDTDLDPASRRANLDFRRALFGSHPLANTIDTADLPKITKASVDSWIHRVHDLRNAVLVVVGDVDADQVAAYAAALSPKPTPATVDQLPAPLPLHLRPPGEAHITTVLTPRRGTMTDVRLACLLPPMRADTRAEYEMLRLAMEQRLLDVLRFEKGDTYGVDVALAWLRGGTTEIELSTFVDAAALADVLATLRVQWQRWASSGFTDGETAVARRLYAGMLSSTYSYGHAIAFHLFNDWNADPTSAGRDTFSEDASSVTPARVSELFATCRANAVLGITGDASVIRRTVENSWPEVR